MLYVSHLIPDDHMACLLKQYHLGVESIEFSIGYCLDAWEERAAAYEKRLEAMGWEGALSIHGPFLDLNPVSWDDKIAAASRERFEQAYKAARRLGAGKVIYHTCFVPSINLLEGWTQRMISFWNGFMEDKGREITVCLENVFDPESAPLAQIAREVTHPAFGLCLDIGHAHWASKEPVEEWMENLKPYIRHLHLHDNHGGWDEHLGLGQGNIPLKLILEFIRDCQKQADLTIENSDIELCRASIAVLEDFFRRI